MKKYLVALVVVIIVVIVGTVFFGKKNESPAIGGDRDEHGCLVAAGYAYDEVVGACIRVFEMTSDIKDAAALAVAHVGPGYALTVVSFNSYEEQGAYDIMLERGIERTPMTVVIKNGKTQSPSVSSEVIIGILSTKLGIDAETILATVDIVGGDFAKGTVNFTEETGGGVWFAAKTDMGWEVVYSGNGIIPCGIADQYEFPKDMVPECLDEKAPHGLLKR